ncbi:MAG: hypothetical protein LJE69_07265 [Thiohalocapsa sp.]|jgi:hypothetical protein|uniref:hypothetical protein n=1 Tax=Thiohalocapsa sp. TaxID=2497641 RepID=UPI0026015B9C|nr:hypothetical protein [Thiohalocapsa sp.]MCG6941034.1 hypothetical protein [Thiohalocapsa sp.]
MKVRCDDGADNLYPGRGDAVPEGVMEGVAGASVETADSGRIAGTERPDVAVEPDLQTPLSHMLE